MFFCYKIRVFDNCLQVSNISRATRKKHSELLTHRVKTSIVTPFFYCRFGMYHKWLTFFAKSLKKIWREHHYQAGYLKLKATQTYIFLENENYSLCMNWGKTSLRKHPCLLAHHRWDVSRETSPAATNEEKRMLSQARGKRL